MRNQPPFGFMLPMLMSGGMPGPEAHQSHPQMTPDNPIPARVKVALELLSMLHQKELPRGAVADGASQILELEGIKPTTHEECASEAACELLSAYLRGKLQMDKWEELRYQAIHKRIEKEELDARYAREQEQQGPVLPCPTCQGAQGIRCRLCRGAGMVVLKPFLRNEEVIDPMHMANQSGGGLDLISTILAAAHEAMNNRPEKGDSGESDDSSSSSDDSEPEL